MTANRDAGYVVGLAAALVLAGVLAAPAVAEEPKSAISARLGKLTTAVAEHKRAKAVDKLQEDIRLLVALHVDSARNPKVRVAVVRLLGSLTRNGKGTRLAEVALEALGKIGDPNGARYVIAHLKDYPRKGKATAAVRAAVAAAAKIRSDDLVDPLLKIVTGSKCCGLAASAVEALGHFGRSKRKRVKILRILVETTAKDRPGSKGRSKPYVPGDQYRSSGDLARNRWAALSRVLPRALTRLTSNEDLAGVNADMWIQLVRENKRNLGDLFSDED